MCMRGKETGRKCEVKEVAGEGRRVSQYRIFL